MPPVLETMKNKSSNKLSYQTETAEEKKPSIAVPFSILLALVLAVSLGLFFRIPAVQYLLIGDSSMLLIEIAEARASALEGKAQSSPAATPEPTPTEDPLPTPTPVPATPAPTIDPGPLLSIVSETGEHIIDRFTSVQLSVEDAEEDSVITWESTDPEVAIVQPDGTVYGKEGGSCFINATDEKGVTGSFLLTVNVPVSSIWFETNPYELDLGYEIELIPVTSPLDATDTSYTLTSDDPSIVQIDGTKIRGISEGRTIVTATAKSGASGETYVEVVPVRAQSVKILNAPETMAVGQSLQLSAELLPADTADKTLTWSTGNAYVLDISPTGMLTANHAGTCGIAVKTVNGLRDYIEITVTE